VVVEADGHVGGIGHQRLQYLGAALREVLGLHLQADVLEIALGIGNEERQVVEIVGADADAYRCIVTTAGGRAFGAPAVAASGRGRQVYGGLYPTSVMYASQSFLDTRPEAAEKIARAEQMALKFIADNSAEDIVAALPDSYVSGDRATYARAVENARAIFTRDGHFTPADLETPLKVLREFNTDVAKANIDLSRTYTNAFVERANAAAPAAQP